MHILSIFTRRTLLVILGAGLLLGGLNHGLNAAPHDASLRLSPPLVADVLQEWHDPARDYRFPIVVEADGNGRIDKPVEVEVNFTSMLQSVDLNAAFDENSIHVVEVDDSGSLVDARVDHQFDHAASYDATSSAVGTLIFIMAGQTDSNQARSYQVYFDRDGKEFPAPAPVPLITLTPFVPDEGQNSYRISTQNGTYYYHLNGGGFSSLDDVDGVDWIGFSNTGQEEFRGIPNMIYPENGFHPGASGSTTTLTKSGPLKVTYQSTYGSSDSEWKALWEVFPFYARMTVLKADHVFWFLYEGTPGGGLDAEDTWVLSDGSSGSAVDGSDKERWCRNTDGYTNWQDFCNDNGGQWAEEWLYFSDPNAGDDGRSIFFAHHQQDDIVDSYKRYSSDTFPMTVMGFGRLGSIRSFPTDRLPQQFTFGLTDETNFSEASEVVRSAYQPLRVIVGPVDEADPEPSTIVTDGFNACELNDTVWSFVDPQAGGPGESTLRMTGTHVEIAVPEGIAHDVWTDGNMAPRLVQPANNTNFELDAKFDSAVSENVQMQGLLALQDDDNFIRLNVQYERKEPESVGKIRLLGVRFSNGSPTIEINEVIANGDSAIAPVYLRLKRTSLKWSASYSFDGFSWTGDDGSLSFYHNLLLSEIGLFAGNAGTNPPGFTSSIDYVYRTDDLVNPADTVALNLDSIIASVDPISPPGVGTIVANPECGDPMNLIATAVDGWRFERWEGSTFESNTNPLERSFGFGEQVTAIFERNAYELSAEVLNPAGGSIDTMPDKSFYLFGEVVTLTAVENEGWRFTGWGGDIGGTETPASITMDADKTVTADFKREYKLNIEQLGQGEVRVEPEQEYYVDGTQVQLNATPASNWAFVEWQGDVNGSDPAIVVTISDDVSVTAVFKQLYLLDVLQTGQGNVAIMPEQREYAGGTHVTLTATAAPGWAFSNWANDVSGTDNSVSLPMDDNKTVEAVFKQVFSLEIATAGDGEVFTQPAQTSFMEGELVTLTPVPKEGNAFVGWMGDLDGAERPAVLLIDSNKSVVAHFEPGYDILVSTVGEGKVILDPGMRPYKLGDEVTATATPTEGWRFVEWTGDVISQHNPLKITVSASTSIVATFEKISDSHTIYLPTIQVNH